MRCLLTSLLTAVILSLSVRAEELTVGSWTLQYDTSGIQSLTYDGKVILRKSTVTGFNPKWKGSYFDMSEGHVSVKRDGDAAEVVWEKEKPGEMSARAVLRLDGESADWDVFLTARRKGPIEVGVLIPPETVRAAPGICQCRFGKSVSTMDDFTDFGSIAIRYDATFLTPECDYAFSPRATDRSWMLQDKRRTSIENLRLIIGLHADGEKPMQAEVGFRLTVKRYPEAEVASRRAFLAQRSRETIAAPVKNPGLEESDKAAGWSCPGNGGVVEENPSQGKRCAKLVVTSEKDRGVYITQRVPVTPGSRYRASALIRAENVKAANVLGMSSVGAKLIVEWADKDGKWLASGAYSKQKGFGTHGWQRHHCDKLLAPEKAGYAIIFLALRGTGTAWFDDVQLSEVRHHTIMLSPADGVQVRDNRPLFRWQEELDAEAYRIALATGPNFADGTAVQEAEVDTPSYRAETPLRPGRYYWRVRLVPGRWSNSWSFTQTAPADADTTGPDITPLSQSITEAEDALRVKITDPSGVAPDTVSLSGVEGARFAVAFDKDIAQIRADGGWPRGAHQVKVKAADGRGNASEAEFWIVVSPAPPKKLTWLCQRGVFNGETCRFPIGIYQVKEQDYAKVKRAGFTMVHQYTWEGSQDDEKARAYLDGVHGAGLTAFVGFDRGGWSKNGLVQNNRQHVANRIAALRDHPGLLAWYLFDEPDLAHQYVAPRNLKAWYRFIKALDPYHPIIVTLACRDSITKYGKGCYDVYWTMAYRDTDYITDLIERHQEELGPGRPHLIILHSYDRNQRRKMEAREPVDDAAFQPDLALFRANAYMALAHGSSGLCWWWYGDGRRRFLSVGDVPAAWGWLSSVVAEVRELRPVLTAEGDILPVTVTCHPAEAKVRAWAKKTASGITVIAVSADAKRSVNVTIGCDAFPAAGQVGVKFEDRKVVIAEGKLTDRFEPIAAHVYEIAP